MDLGELTDDNLWVEMYLTAGKDLVRKMSSALGSCENARIWYYSRVPALGRKMPYEYCLENNHREVFDMVGRIEYGVYS